MIELPKVYAVCMNVWNIESILGICTPNELEIE